MVRAILWQRLEGALILAASLVLFWHGGHVIGWWAALLVFLAPDISFFAYLLGPRAGAFCYNAVHVYAFGAASMALGLVLQLPLLAAAGTLWLAHSGFDRMLGYGLKSPEGFSVTHLGNIGKGS